MRVWVLVLLPVVVVLLLQLLLRHLPQLLLLHPPTCERTTGPSCRGSPHSTAPQLAAGAPMKAGGGASSASGMSASGSRACMHACRQAGRRGGWWGRPHLGRVHSQQLLRLSRPHPYGSRRHTF